MDVKVMNEMVETLLRLKEEKEKLEEPVTEKSKEISAMEQKIAETLELIGQTEFSSPLGTVSIKKQWRFNLPQTDVDKLKFFDYLKERGLFERYATVNSNSYNSYLLAERDIAIKEGRFLDIPGVPEPTCYNKLQARKKR